MSRLVALLALSTPILSLTTSVNVKGRQIFFNGQSLFLKGVNWNPVPKGGQQAHGGVHFRGFALTDSELMAAAGINALRTYEPITDTEVLDILWSQGIHVLNTVYISGDEDPKSVIDPVRTVKDHPAILMWVIGNEWNYNMLYSGMMFPKAVARVSEVANLIKSVDQTHPVATVYGMMPGPSQIAALSNIDVWGLTAYTGISFGNLFELWKSRSEKPMFVAEYGADAYNAVTNSVDEVDQAKATVKLTREILANSVHAHGVCFGGFVFELADEWWKDGKGSPDTHDVGGVAPGGGPYPDSTFNEEYWGIVKNDGTPRQAYRAYAAIVPPGFSHSSKISVMDITVSYRLKACGASPGCSGMLGDCCPTKEGSFRDCCSPASKSLGASRKQPQKNHTPKDHTVTKKPSESVHPNKTAMPLLPWTPEARSQKHTGNHSKAQSHKHFKAPSHCKVGAPVPCCPNGNCGSCAGNQCCPSKQGSVSCPSASKALATGCIHPKLYDCTGKTGTNPPKTRKTTTSLKMKTTRETSTSSRNERQHILTRTTTTNEEPHKNNQKSSTTKGHKRTSGDSKLTTTLRTSTEIIRLAVHTTMKSLDARRSPGVWVLGPEKSSCDAVCADVGGCAEGGWPKNQDEFMQIVNSLGYACFDLQEGGGKYNPSTQQGNCGWNWNGGNSKFDAGDTKTRCAAKAPAFTRRFCPCEKGSFFADRSNFIFQKRILTETTGENQTSMVFL